MIEATTEIITKVNGDVVFSETVKIENEDKKVVLAAILAACEETRKLMKEKLTDKFESMG